MIYEGPPMWDEIEFSNRFYSPQGCIGWCGKDEQRKVALNLIMDRSREHNGVHPWDERGKEQ